MKTAILITGALRSFDKCLPNLEWYVFRNFPGAKFYVACHADEDAPKAFLLNKHAPRAVVETFTQPEMEIPAGCPVTWTKGTPYMHEGAAISVPPEQVMGQLWMLRQGWAMYERSGEEADVIIRCRPDLWFHSFTVPLFFEARDSSKYLHESNIAFTPWWGRFGGVNDRFAVMGAQAAKSYFTTYDRAQQLVDLGCPLHPESMVAASLELGECVVEDNLRAVFSTLRKTGEMRGPEITGVDIADARTS